MRVTSRIVRTWADQGGIPDLTLAELDYRLVHALQAIYAHPFLRRCLCLKGGTALNKLYLPGQDRLSVDLDFNAVGPRDRVLAERTQVSQTVIQVLEEQDSGYDLTYRWRYDQASVFARFMPLTGVAQQRLKVEISFIERFAILGRVERSLSVPSTDLSLSVPTYHLEELTATKLRALYDRRKGRDIYDLFRISASDLNHDALRKMVLYYFYRANKVFQYPAFVGNVEAKMADRAFGDDLQGLIRRGNVFNWPDACRQVLERFAFLGDLDERDRIFLDLAKCLLHRPYPRGSERMLEGIENPLAWLMDSLPISAEAAAMTQEDMKLHLPGTDE